MKLYREVEVSDESEFRLYEWMPDAGEFIHMGDLGPIEITEEEIADIIGAELDITFDDEWGVFLAEKDLRKTAAAILSKLKGE